VAFGFPSRNGKDRKIFRIHRLDLKGRAREMRKRIEPDRMKDQSASREPV
jgi:hypothetical protein